MGRPAPQDERRHDPAGPGWTETWSFELTDRATGVGVHLTLELRPDRGRARLWTAVLGGGRALVSLVDEDLPPPRGAGLELRGPGVWTAPECETPLEHWSLGLEAFAVTLDDPWEALGAARGELTPLGYDLEWETRGEAVPLPGGGYELPCAAHGEVLVGAERLAVEGPGARAHRWGPAPAANWTHLRLHTHDGFRSGPPPADGPPLEVRALAPANVDGVPVVRALVSTPGGQGDGPAGVGWLLAAGAPVASMR